MQKAVVGVRPPKADNPEGNSMDKSKLIVSTALALTGALGAGMAQARDADVQWSVTIGTPVYAQPVPVYTQPVPVYTQPVPVYGRPLPVYTYTAPVVVLPAPLHGHRVYQRPTRWDVDGDGIPNRYDRVYNPRWDRDGDGIPNRYDAATNPRWDRDGDGIPNWRDRHDGGRFDRSGDGSANRPPRHDPAGRGR